MRFGLERMRRLLTALGSPQERFRAVHVVGTNGKSSTVRFTAALLRGARPAHGRLPLAAPDDVRRADPDRRRGPRRRTPSAPRSSAPPPRPRRSTGRSSDGERVTQFELLTAAAFAELARREVEVAVVEAGPGRALRRDQRARRARRRAHQRRARAHALARADDRRHRGREARGGASQSATLVLGDVAPGGRRAGRGHRRHDRPPAAVRRRRCPATSARTSPPPRAAAEAFLGHARPRASSPLPRTRSPRAAPGGRSRRR